MKDVFCEPVKKGLHYKIVSCRDWSIFMKKSRILVIYLCCSIFLAGCGNSNYAGHANKSNSVDDVMKQQMSNAQLDSDEAGDENALDITEQESATALEAEQGSMAGLEEEHETGATLEEETDADKTVDYDLTEMGSDMVYAMVYELMTDPEYYLGMTFKIKGSYYAAYFEPTKQYYHYCMIKDAAACCSQGMEFVWDDGKHIYPDEYPADNTEIIVTGTFETYQEEGDSNLYCRLNHATMSIAE